MCTRLLALLLLPALHLPLRASPRGSGAEFGSGDLAGPHADRDPRLPLVRDPHNSTLVIEMANLNGRQNENDIFALFDTAPVDTRLPTWDGTGGAVGLQAYTVGPHKFNPRNLKLRVSNPKNDFW